MEEKKAKITAEEGKQEIWIEREFDAPRELLFKVCSDPQYIPEWWGGTEVDKMDARTGGEWRFVYKDQDGKEVGFHGVYHEVLAPSRIIETFEWEGLPETGHVLMEITTFEELPENRTKLKIHQVFQSVMDRDGMLQSGMEKGMNETHARLDTLLERLQKE